MPDLQILQTRLQNKIQNRKTKKIRLTVQNFVYLHLEQNIQI